MSKQASLKVNIIVDNDSWVLPYAEELKKWCLEKGMKVALLREHKDVLKGQVAFYLGCIKITPKTILDLNEINLVVHGSELPKGRGFSPLSWQILEGENQIPITLFEASPDAVDSGNIISKSIMTLQGHELAEEWRHILGQKTLRLCCEFLNTYPDFDTFEQNGTPTYYKRRRPEDSMLDISKTLDEQFDLLRIVDNENYPAFFHHRGQRYILKVFKDEENI